VCVTGAFNPASPIRSIAGWNDQGRADACLKSGPTFDDEVSPPSQSSASGFGRTRANGGMLLHHRELTPHQWMATSFQDNRFGQPIIMAPAISSFSSPLFN
jgi:hypothetical protein